MVDFSDVYMIFFLLIEQVGMLKLGGEVWLIFDVVLDLCIFVIISFVVSVVQFMLKIVEISDEWLKLMFCVKVCILLELFQQYLEYVKIGLLGVVWVWVNEEFLWFDDFVVRLL